MRPEEPTNRFFIDLTNGGPVAPIRNMTGTIRFDLTVGSGVAHLTLSIDKGDSAMSRLDSSADAELRSERALVEEIVVGRTNAMAAFVQSVRVELDDHRATRTQ